MADASGFIGKQLGSYRIVAELNSGSYGSVYQGRHLIFEDESVVAIKVLHAHLSSPVERAQFITEAQLLKKLKHPYILPIIDAGIHEGVPFIVTEYAAGGSLQDRLKQQPRQPLPLEEALSILAQVGQALQHAHQQNIVHRDLKPGNILFDVQGKALLADFGIATVLATVGTKDLGLGGTPPYMAPEQFEGIVSMKSDQYALGCIAYELFTGHKSFSLPVDAPWMAWAYKHTIEKPTPPTQLNAHLPLYIEQAILTAMAKQRADRYSDISTFIAALQNPQKTSRQWLNEGIALDDLKRYEEALAAYGQALHLDPNFASAYIGKGLAFLNLKRYEEALAAFEQALRLNPNDAYAYNYKGNVLYGLKRYEEALAAYEQALCLDPNDAVAYNYKGNVLYGLKRYEEALAAYGQALRLDPNFAIAYNNKGIALGNLKRYEEALAAYGQALRLDPNKAIAYYFKGRTLERLGKGREAQQAYEKAKQLGYSG